MSSTPGRDQQPAGSLVEETEDPRRWKALTVCLAAGFMTLLDVSIVNVALPSIQEGLNASESALQWVVAGYALTFGLVLVPAGRLGDARGRRNVFMIGLALFTVSSAVAGAAWDATWLSLARLVQGAAGGILNPQIIGLIQQLFRGAERGRAFGLLGAIIGVSTAIGPLLGGVIIRLFGAEEGWRWVFYVNIPVGVLALVLAWRLIPPVSDEDTPSQDLDPVGVLLLGAGVVVLLLPFVEARQWETALKWVLVPVALLLLTLFVLWENRYTKRGHSPVVNLDLFRVRSYTLGISIATAYFAGFTGIFFIFTLYLQEGLDYSALLAGLAMTPFAIGSAVGSMLGGNVVTRLGRPLIVAGLILVAIGLILTNVATSLHPGFEVAAWTALPLLVAGFGSGLIISPNQTLSLAAVPVKHGGSAGGVLQTGQRVGTAVGIAAASAMFFSVVSSSQGDWALAFRSGLWVIVSFVFLALVLALADVLTTWRQQHR